MITNNYYAIPDTFYGNHLDTLYNRLFRNGLITSTEKHYLNLMDSAVNTYIGNNVPSQAIYDTAANHIITIETAIIADGSLTSSQKELLLGAGSIYRYSYAMWGTYMENNFWSWLWKKFGRNDVSGAISGGIAAAFSGAGLVIGAVGGGIGASIANWIFPN